MADEHKVAQPEHPSRDAVERGARAAYMLNRGVPTDAWERDLPESTKDHWREYATTVLCAAGASLPASPEEADHA